MKILLALLLFTAPCLAQQTRITPPQPNYAQYGSYSRQLRVYEATQRRLDALDRERYRRFRDEVRRNMPKRETCLVVRRTNYTYGDAMTSWRERRRSSGGQQ